MFYSLLFYFLILILLTLEIEFQKCKIVALPEIFTIFNFFCPLFQISNYRNAWALTVSCLRYNGSLCNICYLQTTHKTLLSNNYFPFYIISVWVVAKKNTMIMLEHAELKEVASGEVSLVVYLICVSKKTVTLYIWRNY